MAPGSAWGVCGGAITRPCWCVRRMARCAATTGGRCDGRRALHRRALRRQEGDATTGGRCDGRRALRGAHTATQPWRRAGGGRPLTVARLGPRGALDVAHRRREVAHKLCKQTNHRAVHASRISRSARAAARGAAHALRRRCARPTSHRPPAAVPRAIAPHCAALTHSRTATAHCASCAAPRRAALYRLPRAARRRAAAEPTSASA